MTFSMTVSNLWEFLEPAVIVWAGCIFMTSIFVVVEFRAQSALFGVLFGLLYLVAIFVYIAWVLVVWHG